MNIHYLEIVTPDVEETCATLTTVHGAAFGEPVAALGNARTVTLKDGSRIGVRAPMHESEEPVVRPYIQVADIEVATAAAAASGGEIAHPPLEIPGQGKFSIYFQGGMQYGLWEVDSGTK